MSEELSDLIAEAMRIQSQMAASLVEHRGHIAAVQFSVLAIVEQLSAKHLVNAPQAADRLLELSRLIDDKRFLEKIQPQLNETAGLLRSLAAPEGPRPLRGSKPRIVK